jgi:sugar/nucleoside kinase (ribokinase family)
MPHALPTTFPAGRPFDVVGLGENSVDELAVVERFPEPGGKVRITHREIQGGGQVATAMVACQRLGLRARYVGKVGDDHLGPVSRESLVAEGVDVSALRTEPGARSRYAFVAIEQGSGDRTVLFEQDARLAFRPGELERETITSARVLHVDATDLEASLQAARWAREDGMAVVIDVDHHGPGVDELFALANVCIVSAGVAFELAGGKDRGQALRALAGRTRGFTCITLGDAGAAALIDGAVVELPAFQVEAVDTTACGDVFHAAFIAGMLRGAAPREIMRYASAAAAMKTRSLGGRPGIPRHAEVLAFLERA